MDMPAPGPISIDSPAPLDPGTLVFRSMVANEELGRPFFYDIEVTSSRNDLAAADVLGASATVNLQTTDGDTRHFNGLVARLDYLGTDRGTSTYHLVLRPWLWFLTRNNDCRIFQNMTVPDIIKQVFTDRGFEDFDFSALMTDSYQPHEYVVQYRESDFSFVTRLMEREGIYYYFEHDSGKHTLVLVDSCVSHEAPSMADGSASFTLPLRPPDPHRDATIEYVGDWCLVNAVEPGKYSLADYDFTKSRARLMSSRSDPAGHAHDDLEVYDYPGGFSDRGAGDAYAQLRLQERQQPVEQINAQTNARKMTVGYLFTLSDHPRDDQNRDYLVIGATHRLRGHDIETAAAPDSEAVITTAFRAIDAKKQFRALASVPKPFVRGPQTAIVVGPDGEEIWTDNYGRVKVQFPWDRVGTLDENSSCWVRVAQVWAGSNWGGIHIPRIGQEVIVDFLEGDPDHPIITGRVYNDANMPPYALPGNQTQSGIKSRSTKGGSTANANEIRFEDRKGSEEFYAQAEKNLTVVVKNDESDSIGADRSVSVGNNDTLTVGSNRKATIGANDSVTVTADRSLTVSGNESITVAGNRSTTTGGNDTVTTAGSETTAIGGDQSLAVAGGQTVAIAAAQNISVGATRSLQVTGSETVTVIGPQTVTAAARQTTIVAADSLTVGAAASMSVAGGRSADVGGDDSVSVGGAGSITIGKDGSIKVGKQFTIEATDGIVIKAGDASITLQKSGDIVIKGKNISENASGNVTVKGSKISQN
jgi:type VI secretion system secreted protein VgrG